MGKIYNLSKMKFKMIILLTDQSPYQGFPRILQWGDPESVGDQGIDKADPCVAGGHAGGECRRGLNPPHWWGGLPQKFLNFRPSENSILRQLGSPYAPSSSCHLYTSF